MAVKMKYQGEEYTLEDLEWDADEEDIVEMLDLMLEPNNIPGYVPSPDRYEANRIAEIIGAEITDLGPEPEFDPDAIY